MVNIMILADEEWWDETWLHPRNCKQHQAPSKDMCQETDFKKATCLK